MALRPLNLRSNKINRNVRFPRRRSRLLPRLVLVCAFFLTVWLFYAIISFFMGDKEEEVMFADSADTASLTHMQETPSTASLGTAPGNTSPGNVSPGNISSGSTLSGSTASSQSNAEIAAQATRQYRAQNSTLPPNTPLLAQEIATPQQSIVIEAEPASRQNVAPLPVNQREVASDTKQLHGSVSWNIPYVGFKLTDITAQIEQKHPTMRPSKLEFQPAGVHTHLASPGKAKHIALTIDGCGPFGADDELFALLNKEKIPTAFFLSSTWIVKHKKEFTTIEKNPLFSIQGHGKKHLPLSLQGEQVSGVKGTDSLLALLQEIEGNVRDVQRLTNKRPQWFRGAFSLYDKGAINAVSHELNLPIAGYSLDANDSTADAITAKLLKAQANDIIMLRFTGDPHLSQALTLAIPRLKAQGFTFVSLPTAPAR